MDTEWILIPNDRRFVLFPIKYLKIWKFCKRVQASIRTTGDLNPSVDCNDWTNVLESGDRTLVLYILAFLVRFGGNVNETFAMRFGSDVQIAEARYMYGIQNMMEKTHLEIYSRLIDA